MEVRYQQQSVSVKEGETVLAALLRRGLPVRYSCRAGSCHTCMMRVAEGRVPTASQRGLRADLAARGYFLPCCCRPEEDLRIESPLLEHLAVRCQVTQAFMLGEDVRCIRLAASDAIDPLPGQHLRILHPDGQARCYSVASLPGRDGHLELHVRRVPGGRVSGWLVDEVRVGDRLQVLPPAGELVQRLGDEQGGLLLVATGTGLAPMMPILRQALERPGPAPIWLLHGARRRRELYADARLREIARLHPRLHYQPCCSRKPGGAGYFHGRVSDWLRRHWPADDLAAVRAAGRPEMVGDVVALCRRQPGGEALDIRTDPFHLAGKEPRVAARVSESRHAPPPDPALWSRLGNGSVLREVLRDFYDAAFEDERLGPYFSGVTRQRLREKQFSFLRSLILGRRDYMGQRPRNAHHWMVISNDLFDYRLELMAQCMRTHGLTESWIRRWHVFEEFFRADIVKDEPIPRRVGSQDVLLDGIEEARLADGGQCDGCQRLIERGEKVRFHLRLGVLHCLSCSDGDQSVQSTGPVSFPAD